MTGPRRLLLPLTGAHALNHAFLLALPPILGPLMEEFHTGTLGGGTALMWLYLASGLGALPGGWLADRIGGRRLVSVYLSGAAVCLILIAAAPNLAGLSLAALLLGSFCSLYHPAGLAAISRHCRPVGRAMGIHGMGGNLGLAMGPFLVAGMTTLVGWRPALGILAALGLLLLPAFRSGRAPVRPRPDRPTGPVPRPAPESTVGFALSVAAIALSGFCYRGVLTFLPLHLSRHSGSILPSLDPVGAGGLLTTFCLLVGMGGQYFGGRRGHPGSAAGSYGLFLLVAVPFPFLMGTLQGIPLVIASALFAFFFFAAQPIGNLLVARHSGEGWRSLGYGISFSLNFGLGSLAAPTGGWLAQERGLAFAFPTMGIPLIGALLVAGILAWTARRGGGEPAGEGRERVLTPAPPLDGP